MRQFLSAAMAAIVLLGSVAVAQAQVRPSVFSDYDTFSAFLDEKIMKRQFGALFQSMGSGSQLKLSDLQKITTQAQATFPVDFENTSVMKRDEMENGFVQEARAYWSGEVYAFVYVLLHQREGEIVVVNLSLHGAPGPLLAPF